MFYNLSRWYAHSEIFPCFSPLIGPIGPIRKNGGFYYSSREARGYTWYDQRFVSVNIAAREPARKIVILEDFAC